MGGTAAKRTRNEMLKKRGVLKGYKPRKAGRWYTKQRKLVK